MKPRFQNFSRSLVIAISLVNSTFAADDSLNANLSQPSSSTPEISIGPELVKIPVEEIERAYEGKTQPEAIRMYLAIAKGSMMGPSDGWFGPAQTRFDWNWLAEQHGIELDGDIPVEKFQGLETWFARLDRNRDGKITKDDLNWSERNPWVQQAYQINRLFRKIDPNGDGKLNREEWLAFFDAVSHGKNEMTSEELRDAWLAGLTAGFLPGDAPTKEILIEGLFSGEVGSLHEGPNLNDLAPDFALKTQDGTQTIRLSEVVGSKPIVLVFGNFTCGPFRSMYPGVEEVYRRFKDDAVFLGVYVREAHPTDGWKMEANTKVGVAVAQPKTYQERTAVAQQCHQLLKPAIPLLVDEIDDPTGNAYSAMPARLYVIDTKGRVVYKGGRGPFGFKTGEMEQALVMTMMEARAIEETAATNTPAKSHDRGGETRLSLLSDAEAWNRLPSATMGQGQPLPTWARMVAVHLPRTAAAMLQLDFAHRTCSPLNPALRAKMRWVIAHANRCSYSVAYALSDLERAGADANSLKTLTGNPAEWPADERDPLEFARQLTVEAPTISDTLFERLRSRFGEKQVASMVLLAAYGNFQDRIVLGLNLPMEANGPLPPLEVRFGEGAFQMASLFPDQIAVPKLLESGLTVVPQEPAWLKLTYEELQSRLEGQRGRKPRLPIPTWDEVKKNLPAAMTTRPTRILWNLVCSGYVPELAVPWSISTRTMWAETKPDRVFEESLFWIQTRSLECNYCMGHCEMLLEVAGLDKKSVTERTRALASSDWSRFPPEEQRAYAFARKLTRTPWNLTAADYQTLESDLGPEKAMATFWWLCRGLYMTRVSDGFQLPLERENVFEAPATQVAKPNPAN